MAPAQILPFASKATVAQSARARVSEVGGSNPSGRPIPAAALHGIGTPEMEGASEAFPAAARRLGFGESDVPTEGAWKERR